MPSMKVVSSEGEAGPGDALLQDSAAMIPEDGIRVRADGRLVVRDADVDRGFAAAVDRLDRFVRLRARALSCGDRALGAELAQEAWIKLWELDPLRFETKDLSYVRTALVSHMRSVVRGELERRGGRETVHVHLRLA